VASRRIIALPVALVGALLVAAPSHAQVRAGHASARGPVAARHGQAPPFTSRRNGFAQRGRRGVYNDGLFYYPDLFSDYYEPGEIEEPPVQQVVVQPVQAAQPEAAAKPIEPVILEEQNGRWVRVPIGSQAPVGQPEQANFGQASGLRSAVAGNEETAPPAAALPPAVLVFRDGHQEEVRDYMIQGNVLYTNADYWSTGSWTRKIPLADLDVPASLKLNAERGAKFNLPRGPNQVVVRF